MQMKALRAQLQTYCLLIVIILTVILYSIYCSENLITHDVFNYKLISCLPMLLYSYLVSFESLINFKTLIYCSYSQHCHYYDCCYKLFNSDLLMSEQLLLLWEQYCLSYFFHWTSYFSQYFQIFDSICYIFSNYLSYCLNYYQPCSNYSYLLCYAIDMHFIFLNSFFGVTSLIYYMIYNQMYLHLKFNFKYLKIIYSIKKQQYQDLLLTKLKD